MEEVTDLTPERCPYTWTPESDGVHYKEVRCTLPANPEDHPHHWRQDEQYAWMALVQERVIAAAGWTTPTAHLGSVAAGGCEIGFDIPEIQATRGAPVFGTHVPRVKPEPAPVDPRGHWEYGVDTAGEGEEPDIMASSSAWHWEPYLTAEDALAEWDGKLVRRWVPARGPWDEVN